MEILTRTINCVVVSSEYATKPSSARLIVKNSDGEEFSLWHYCSKELFLQSFALDGKRKRIRYYPGSKEIVSISDVSRYVICITRRQ